MDEGESLVDQEYRGFPDGKKGATRQKTAQEYGGDIWHNTPRLLSPPIVQYLTMIHTVHKIIRNSIGLEALPEVS